MDNWKLNGDTYYLAGISETSIYLGNTMNPNGYLLIDPQFKHASFSRVNFSKTDSKYPVYLKIVVDSPHIFVVEGVTPTLWKGLLGDSELVLSIIDNTHFLGALPLSDKTWILKTYDRKLAQTILLKKRFVSFDDTICRYVIEKAEEGIFSTDGSLEYNADSRHLFFTYNYRNKFVCLDTNLRILYSGKTIDTIEHPSIKIMIDEDKKMTSIAGNSLLVNKSSSVSEDNLFVQSALMANNENRSIFDHVSVVDLYNDTNGKYQYSFYIPNFQEEAMKSFKVRKNRLIALYDHYLVLYRINYLLN